MKYLLTFTVGILLLFTSVPATADQAEDIAAIRKAREKRIATYNTQNLKLADETVAEDVEDWLGNVKGRDAFRKVTADLFRNRWKKVVIKQLDEIGIVFVTPDVAIFKSRQEYSGMVDETGMTIPAYEVLFAEIYLKRKGKWLAHSWYWRPTEE